MSKTISFVTESHTFGTDTISSVDILDDADVQRIAREVTHALLDEVRHNIEELSGRIGQMKTALDDVRGRIDHANNQFSSLNQQFASLPDDQRLLDAVRRAVHDELAPLLGHAEKNLSAILEENKNLSDDYGKLLEDNGKLQNDTARLRGDVKTLHASVDDLKNILATIAKVWKESNF